MKILALLLVVFVWLLILSFMKLNIKFLYHYYNFTSDIMIDLKILFAKQKIELKIPKEMYSSGIINFFNNLVIDLEENQAADKKKVKPKIKSKRYVFLKRFKDKIIRHYVYSWPRLIWLKRKFLKLKNDFFKKINICGLNAEVQVGCSDAAQTGLLTGAIWILFGQIMGRCYRLFRVRKNNINYNVVPCFDTTIFLCKLDCILSLKISHIIFTVLKFLLIILKNRRVRNYG